MSLEEKKVPDNVVVDEQIANAIQAHLVDNQLPCASAFAIARNLGIEPIAVGRTSDALKIKLTRCQLGLFGYPGKQGWDKANIAALPASDELKQAIREHVDEEDHLPCAEAWAVASEFKVPRMQVGYLADRLGIKITPCQLGAF